MGYEARNGQPGRKPLVASGGKLKGTRRLAADMQLPRPYAGKKSNRTTRTPWTRKAG